MKKSFGFGKKNLYLGLAFLVVVGLLSLFVFSGAREGFYVKKGNCDSGQGGYSCLNAAEAAGSTLSGVQVASL
jgi:prenyltransferase beta subunit